jgi:hypothetical protein
LNTWFPLDHNFLAFCHNTVGDRDGAFRDRNCLKQENTGGNFAIWVRSDVFGAGKPAPALGFSPNSLQQRSGLFPRPNREGSGEEQGIYGKTSESVFAAIRDRVSNLCKGGAND